MLGVFAIGLLLFLVGYYGYLGGFQSVKVQKEIFAAKEVVFGTHRGHYKTLNISWDKFIAKLKTAGLETCDSYGVYLDPPETTKEDLRSILACTLTGLSPELIDRLKKEFPTFVLPEMEVYASTFPHKNEASFFVAPFKVYPEFQKLIATDAIRPSVAIEAYGAIKDTGKIHFYMPANTERSAFQPLMDAFKEL